MAHPNPSLTAPAPRPVLERNPERLWQAVSLVLAIVVIVLLLGRG